VITGIIARIPDILDSLNVKRSSAEQPASLSHWIRAITISLDGNVFLPIYYKAEGFKSEIYAYPPNGILLISDSLIQYSIFPKKIPLCFF